jgi:hypothetical protein
VAPRLGQVGKIDEAFPQLRLTVVGAFDDTDRDLVVGSVQKFDRVAVADVPLGVDRQVGAGPGGLGEAFDETGVTHPYTEFEARDPGFGDAQQGAADPPALTDDAVREVDSGDGEVVAEGARLDRDAKHCSPPGVVLGGVGVNGFGWSTVDSSVGLVVAIYVDAAEPATAGDGLFPDGGGHSTAVPVHGAWLANVDCDNSTDCSHHTIPTH